MLRPSDALTRFDFDYCALSRTPGAVMNYLSLCSIFIIRARYNADRFSASVLSRLCPVLLRIALLNGISVLLLKAINDHWCSNYKYNIDVKVISITLKFQRISNDGSFNQRYLKKYVLYYNIIYIWDKLITLCFVKKISKFLIKSLCYFLEDLSHLKSKKVIYIYNSEHLKIIIHVSWRENIFFVSKFCWKIEFFHTMALTINDLIFKNWRLQRSWI